MPGCNWAKNLSFSVEPTKKTYRPIVFVIHRFTFAFFSDFYQFVMAMMIKLLTSLNLSYNRGAQHLPVLRTTSIVWITCSHRWTLPERPNRKWRFYITLERILQCLVTITEQEPTEENDEYKTTIKTLADYFQPQNNVDRHVYFFCQEKQNSGENMIEFYTRLQLLECKREFADTEWKIKLKTT